MVKLPPPESHLGAQMVANFMLELEVRMKNSIVPDEMKGLNLQIRNIAGEMKMLFNFFT